ncbi:hypothetical protein RMR21_014880 [Agrobacterium sp. rho-8.1]|nr:hypothetical protein [Agrobacterium sp. rho-8.1]
MVDFDRYISDAYKDLENPDYSFVRLALENNLHSEIEEKLKTIGFTVADDTEPNTDVCRTLIASADTKQFCIKLSFVGPFAAAFALTGSISDMKEILDSLENSGFSILENETLLTSYSINLLDLDSDPTLYNALFSSDPIPAS